MSAPGGGTGNKLTDSPTNLKEAIDWILRVTNKDGLNGKPEDHCWCDLADGVADLLQGIESQLTPEEKKIVQNVLDVMGNIGGNNRIRDLIDNVASQLAKFIGYEESGGGGGGGSGVAGSAPGSKLTGKGIGCCGNKSGCTCGSGKSGCTGKKYESKYTQSDKFDESLGGGDDSDDDNSTNKVREAKLRCAKILLGVIPFIFSGLSYMAWMAGSGKWNGNTFRNNTKLLHHYISRMGYKWDQLAEKKDGKEVFKVIKSSGILGKEDPKDKDYAQYLEKLRTEAGKEAQEESKEEKDKDKHSLLKLNILCSGYFRSLHTIDSIRSSTPRLPRTVREILYWLTSLPYCPIYRTLVPKVQEMFRRVGTGGKVVFYGSNWTGNKELKVSDKNCAYYLLGAALIAPMVLLTVQDTIECLMGKVPVVSRPGGDLASNGIPIHDLYANMQFWFSYPLSETQSYYLLQDCLVALYYQLYFLREQCNWQRTRGDGFGWAACRYGDGVNSDECGSWICPVGKEYAEALGEKTKVEKELKELKDKQKKELEENDKEKSKEEVKKKVDEALKEVKEKKKEVEKKLEEKQKELKKCGSGTSNPSPLQAFLCDCLKGFTCPVVMEDRSEDGTKYQEKLQELRKNSKNIKYYEGAYPEFLEHRTHTSDVFGTECAVPMGFSGSFRKGTEGGGAGGSGSAGSAVGSKGGSGVTGNTSDCVGLGIDAVLRYYADENIRDSSLYQITRCICSLTRRVPRSTGTLYGFFYTIGEMCKKDGGGTGGKAVNEALSKEFLCCPGYRDPQGLMETIGKWRGTSHATDHVKGSIDSLSGCKTPGVTCGHYLNPLSGSLYNTVAPEFCETYVSWIVHLTWRLQSGLESLRDEFVKIDCSNSGCTGKSGGSSSHCCEGGTDHGKECSCANVVDCVGVHGLFYRFGFTYNSPGNLSGKENGGKYKRECDKFYERLKEVIIDGTYYKELQTQLRNFIYTTRALFGLYIGVYWSVVLVYLLWSMTVNLDLMHIQSHWRSPGSYLLPVQRLLANGSRNVKRVCTIGYFQDSGDRLLSLGVSDVYL
ncbi:variant erythrocyte surface antigen beta subunit, putative [Babesia ovis]|uniref:Variant erythrocyte surface antigen beta subunit, putative n=1 Tax=Babesia ovis TaxID=5869 RepID=A0A9W5TE43_BABOV|nr:variant erythrocyte surface antigen beta subunit, putative [Babesia ovis]